MLGAPECTGWLLWSIRTFSKETFKLRFERHSGTQEEKNRKRIMRQRGRSFKKYSASSWSTEEEETGKVKRQAKSGASL